MHRRRFFIGLLAVCTTLLVAGRRAAAWALIKREELERESAVSTPIQEAVALPQPDAPTIEVEQPDAAKPVTSPVTIRVRFRPQLGATIDPSSFRAKYGWLGIDITDRIITNAKVDASGIIAHNADIPAGQYRVTLQIADNLHRVGTRVLDFRVV